MEGCQVSKQESKKVHNFYKRQREPSLLERIRTWFERDRWIIKNPRYTRKHPKTVADLFNLRDGEF